MGLAVVFPGQGCQVVGMGRDLALADPLVADTFAEADAVLGAPLARIMMEGPESSLGETSITQPAILTVSVAMWRRLLARHPGLRPLAAAGHSLGEYSALVAAGSMTFEDALRLVRFRGQAMQEAVPMGHGRMVAILGLQAAVVEDLCHEVTASLHAPGSIVQPAAYNCPGQVVVSGSSAAVQVLVERAERAGCRKWRSLNVSAPFHCDLLQPARRRMAAALERVSLRPATFPIIQNADGAAHTDPDEIIQAVKWIQPCFGGINLEDIESPKCFYLLDKLREILEIPVWHDDQQGTATVTVAGLMNALKIVNKKMNEVVIALIGAGAANVAIARLLVKAGVDPKKMRVVDSKGILHPAREDIEKLKKTNPWKYNLAMTTNKEGIQGGIPEAMKGADVVIAASRPGPGVIKPEWVKAMASDPIVFAMANPIPEIWPWEAKEAGAKVVATGRSDFPNQVNNSLGFPAIFRGALDVMAKTITDEMCIAAAEALSKYAEEKGLHEDYIIPTMEETECFIREAVAVGLKAIEQGVARRKLSKDELYKSARKKITESQKLLKLMMDGGIIPVPRSL